MTTADGSNTTGSSDASGRRPRGLLIHIGYHKTGTTWLQKSLFCDEMAGFCQPWTRGEIHKWLILVNALSFDGEAARAYFEPGRRESLGRGLAPVVTAERLSGNPHSGGTIAANWRTACTRRFPMTSCSSSSESRKA